MAFIYYNKDTDYQGEDLHMLRNNQPFPLHKFFDTSEYSATYKFRLKGDFSTLALDGISITNNYEIIAVPHNNPADTQIDNFFVEVTINNQTIVILIHLHDQLDSIWTSPNKLSLRKGMEVKFGVLAQFGDNNYADFSFYPDLAVTKINNDNTVKLNNNRISWNSSPGEYPHDIPAVVKITLPRYMRNNDDEVSITGDLTVLEDNGILELIFGDNDEESINNRMNFLCLSDGFSNSSAGTQAVFKDYIQQIRSYMLESDALTPWNLFASSGKINLWSYYTNDIDSLSQNEGEFIKISDSNGDFLLAGLHTFIEECDIAIINSIKKNIQESLNGFVNFLLKNQEYNQKLIDYLDLSFFKANPNDNPSFPLLHHSPSVNFLSLSEVCMHFGLPSERDLTMDLSTKSSIWKSLGWHEKRDGTSIKYIKFPSDTIVQGDYFFHDYVYLLWQKLGKRIHLEKTDTTYGMTNTYKERAKGQFKPKYALDFSKLKFKNWLDYGKFIHNIKGPQSNNLGTKFYNSQGDPVRSKKRGEEVIDGVTYTVFDIKQANNIAILSRNYNSEVAGYNQSDTLVFPGEQNPILVMPRTAIINIDDKIRRNITIPFSLLDNKKYKLDELVLPSNQLTNANKNIFVHELSHNYFLDEYSTGEADFETLEPNEQKEQSFMTKFTNLQTMYELVSSKPGSGGKIKAENIKWLWPRIANIFIGRYIEIHSSSEITLLLRKYDYFNMIQEGEKLLLRKSDLFTTNYIKCEVLSVTNGEAYIQIKVNTFGQSITNDLEYRPFYLIRPHWINETEYEQQVHPITKNWIDINNKPLVEISEDSKIQTIDSNDAVFKNIDKSSIVGLFAGGVIKYGFKKGIYHASGFCIMRNVNPTNNSGKEIPNSFCQICRYILVDSIEPSLHPIIDKEYGDSNSYPTINK